MVQKKHKNSAWQIRCQTLLHLRFSHISFFLKKLHFVFPNAHISFCRLYILYGTTTGTEAYKLVKDLCCTFVYTDAAEPIQLFTPNSKTSFPVKPIETVSTIGAGDNFNAGFCYAMYKEGITDAASVKDLSADTFSRLVESGQRFSAEVCQSMDNYIGLRLKIRG